jgi:anti-sigma factor RsiW
MNACQDKVLLLNGLADGELDAANSVALEAHVRVCPDCAEELARIEAVRSSLAASALRYSAPDELKARLARRIADEAAGRPTQSPSSGRARASRAFLADFNARWAVRGALAGIAASVAVMLAVPQLTLEGTQDQVVASHVRSLLADHLTDVATSDRHVVKPWFNGKLDFAPPVVELAERGFPLQGGRLDYIDGRVVAALVYGRHLHTINLFVRPANGLVLANEVASRHDGYSLMRWTAGGLEFWAVSDVDVGDLRQFCDAFLAQAGL